MNNQDRVPTIAELWKEADGLIRLSIPHLEKLASPDYQVNEDMRPIYVQQLASCNERLQYLRQQLVERCKLVCSMEIEISSPNCVHIVFKNSAWLADVDDLREMSAAYAFWAWELQQMEKEANGD